MVHLDIRSLNLLADLIRQVTPIYEACSEVEAYVPSNNDAPKIEG
jgi:hypothetical protein